MIMNLFILIKQELTCHNIQSIKFLTQQLLNSLHDGNIKINFSDLSATSSILL